MSKPSLPVLLQQFFVHLRATQELSHHTIAAYRDSLKLLLHFMAKEQCRSLDRITFEAFSPETILAFLEHLLGDARCDFGGVVTHADDGIGAQLTGVGEHQVEGIFARAFAKIGVERDVPAENGLDARAHVADDRARPHDDATHDAERLGHAIAGQIKCGGCQWMCQTHSQRLNTTTRPDKSEKFPAVRAKARQTPANSATR